MVILAYQRPLPQGEGALQIYNPSGYPPTRPRRIRGGHPHTPGWGGQLGEDAVAAEDAGHVSVAEDEYEHDDDGESH